MSICKSNLILTKFLEKLTDESKNSNISDEKLVILLIYLSNNVILFIFEY